MKKILLCSLLAISFFMSAQDSIHFRINKMSQLYFDIAEASPELLHKIEYIDGILDNNNSVLSSLTKDNLAIYSHPVSAPFTYIDEIKKMESVKVKNILPRICFDCYQKEYEYQNKRMQAYIDSFEFKNDFLLTENEDNIRFISDTIISLTKRKYVFSKIEKYEAFESGIRLKYLAKDENEPFVIDFIDDLVGKDKNREIAGKHYYLFKNLSGRYLDVFPIWKRFFQPMADFDEILKTVTDANSHKKPEFCRVLKLKDYKIIYRLRYNNNDNEEWTISKEKSPLKSPSN